MCNCGNKRQQYGAGHYLNHSNNQPVDSTQNKIWTAVYFEYTGLSALTVTGSMSGKHYRFSNTGNIQAVDFGDAAGMMAVPVLRKVNQR